jgi:hypothetical protein
VRAVLSNSGLVGLDLGRIKDVRLDPQRGRHWEAENFSSARKLALRSKPLSAAVKSVRVTLTHAAARAVFADVQAGVAQPELEIQA